MLTVLILMLELVDTGSSSTLYTYGSDYSVKRGGGVCCLRLITVVVGVEEVIMLSSSCMVGVMLY